MVNGGGLLYLGLAKESCFVSLRRVARNASQLAHAHTVDFYLTQVVWLGIPQCHEPYTSVTRPFFVYVRVWQARLVDFYQTTNMYNLELAVQILRRRPSIATLPVS